MKQKSNLSRHIKSCLKVKQQLHKCSQLHCEKTFLYKSKLDQHLLSHQHTTYPCYYCNKTFKRNDHFTKHTCNNEMPTPSFVFNTTGDLNIQTSTDNSSSICSLIVVDEQLDVAVDSYNTSNSKTLVDNEMENNIYNSLTVDEDDVYSTSYPVDETFVPGVYSSPSIVAEDDSSFNANAVVIDNLYNNPIVEVDLSDNTDIIETVHFNSNNVTVTPKRTRQYRYSKKKCRTSFRVDSWLSSVNNDQEGHFVEFPS